VYVGLPKKMASLKRQVLNDFFCMVHIFPVTRTSYRVIEHDTIRDAQMSKFFCPISLDFLYVLIYLKIVRRGTEDNLCRAAGVGTIKILARL
jgi:hypothetical protein